jgi:oligosaccharide repeat unit polymerase
VFLDYIASLLFSCLILAQALLVKRYTGTWLAPGAIFGSFWFLFTFIPLIVAPEVPVNPVALIFIFGCAVLFSVSCAFIPIRSEVRRQKIEPRSLKFNLKLLKFFALMCSSVAFLSAATSLNLTSFSFGNITLALSQTSSAISDRYSGEGVSGISAQIGRLCMFASAPLLGIIAGDSSRPLLTKWLPAALAVPLLFIILDGAKGYLPLSIALFGSGILCSRLIHRDFGFRLFPLLYQGGVILAALSPFIIYSFLARGLSLDISLSEILFHLRRGLASYSSGHLFAFSDWFSDRYGGSSILSYSQEPLTGGFYSYMAIFQLFGDSRYVPPGVYPEYFYYSNYMQTNIFTAFRGYLTDFGLAGTLGLFFFAGLLVHFVFYNAMTARKPAGALALITLFVGYSYSTFIISQFIWLTTIASTVLVWIALFFAFSRITRS